MMLIRQASIVALAAGSVDSFVNFQPSRLPQPSCASFMAPSATKRNIPTWGSSIISSSATTSCLCAANKGDDGGKKRRRKRKIVTPDESAQVPVSSPQDSTKPLTKADVEPEVSAFKFDKSEALALGIENAVDEDDIPPELKAAASPNIPLLEKGAIELPSMQDVVRKKKTLPDKALEEEVEADNEEKIDRKDIQKFRQLLEVEPNADTDMSFFVPDEYNTVSALLGEGAKTFLGLPLEVLQVGHFILALGIVLMAFVQYPGFPLTNLPSPLRGALQGGLGTIYLVNTVLAVLAVIEANKRGQPSSLWAIKTFTVGGLAFDQLTQLPTTEQLAKSKKNKGNRRGRK